MFANNNRKLVKCLPVLAHKQGELLMRLPNHRMPNWFPQNMIKLLSNHGWARAVSRLSAGAFCNFWHLARFCIQAASRGTAFIIQARLQTLRREVTAEDGREAAFCLVQ